MATADDINRWSLAEVMKTDPELAQAVGLRFAGARTEVAIDDHVLARATESTCTCGMVGVGSSCVGWTSR